MNPTPTSIPQPQNPTNETVGNFFRGNQPLQSKFLLLSILLAFLAVIFTIGVAVGNYLSTIKEPPTEPAVSLPTRVPTAFPTVDQTGNWETYTNKRYGYSLRYPQEITYEESSSYGTKNKEEITTTFTTEGSSLKIFGNAGGRGVSSIKSEAILISGIPTVKFYETENSGVIKAIETGFGDSIYFSFTLSADKMKAEAHDRLFDHVLSTFKFLDQTETSGTENWKTYTSSKFSYSISYPNNWVILANDSNGINVLSMGKRSTSGGFTYGGQSVLVEVAPENLTNKDYLITNIAPNSNPINLGDITINGSPGEKWSFNDNNESDNYAVFFSKNGQRYVLVKELGNKSQFNDYNVEVDQVLSTFKFTQ